MATSSIFHNVELTTPQEVKAFYDALVLAEKDKKERDRNARNSKASHLFSLVTDKDEIARLQALRRTNREGRR